MHIKPWEVAVLRVRVHTHPRAVAPYSWEVLGTLQDVNWDRATPAVFGAEFEKTYLVNVEDLGLDLHTCMEYNSAVNALTTMQAYHDLFHSCPATYDHAAEEMNNATIARLGPAIHAAVMDNFPAWRAATDQLKVDPPPWVGAPSVTPASDFKQAATDDSADLYI
jgi:hypothetical protein